MWVFRECQNETDQGRVLIWKVGFYEPTGYFVPIYEFDERVDAAQKVHFLNGGD